MARTTPPIDEEQNWFLLRAQEEDGYTTLEFWRKFSTCDDSDIMLRVRECHSDTIISGYLALLYTYALYKKLRIAKSVRHVYFLIIAKI